MFKDFRQGLARRTRGGFGVATTCRHWFSTVYTGVQVRCPQCRVKTTFNQLVEGITRSGPLGTESEARVAGQNYADTCNQIVEAAAAEEEAAALAAGGGGGGGGAGSGAGAMHDAQQAEKMKKEAAAEDVEVELSQQMVDLTSPSKPPPPKKHKDGGGDGGSASQAIEFSQ